MSRFNEETKIIPRSAWVIAVVVALIIPICMFLFVLFNRMNYGRTPEHMGWFAVPILVGLAIMLAVGTYILIIGYIAADSRRRGMRPVLWTLLAIFVPNAIGIILYFILREPLLQQCSKCGAGSNPTFAFCSVCGEALSKTCPVCKNAVQIGWSHCARCGAPLSVGTIPGT